MPEWDLKRHPNQATVSQALEAAANMDGPKVRLSLWALATLTKTPPEEVARILTTNRVPSIHCQVVRCRVFSYKDWYEADGVGRTLEAVSRHPWPETQGWNHGPLKAALSKERFKRLKDSLIIFYHKNLVITRQIKPLKEKPHASS